ncbi:MAG: hypothetical protein JNG85_14085, partial [Spirochaetaceae bacterium]|nr:hypothetical protein [Spirochaetaceae bacterium]
MALLALAASALAGCDSSSSLFSEAERRSIYTVNLSSSKTRLVDGAAVQPGTSIEVELLLLRGAQDPALFAIELRDAKDALLLERRYSSAEPSSPAAPPASAGSASAVAASQSGAERSAVHVDKLSGTLAPFLLPADLEPGVYRMVSILYDGAGKLLQRSSSLCFVGQAGLAVESVSLYPPAPRPGQAVLLSVAVAGESPADDLWVRWSSEGRTVAEGRLSEGASTAVWRAPRVDGAYAIRAEVFPAAPPKELSFGLSPWRQDIKALVRGTLVADEYADATAFLSRFAFEGSLEDSGTRSVSSPPAPIGAPRLDVYSSGFGYRFDSGSGLRAPGALPPAGLGAGAGYTLLWRLYVEAASYEKASDLARFVDAAGEVLLRVGVEGQRPFVELAGGVRSQSSVRLPVGRVDLALTLRRDGARAIPLWILDGEPVASESLPFRALEGATALELGGPGGLVGLYDEFAIHDDAARGQPRLFFAAAERRYGDSLFVAEGFEAAAPPAAEAVAAPVPAGARLEGAASWSPRAFTLAPGARLSFDRDLPVERPLLVEANRAAGDSGLSVALGPEGGEPLLTVRDSGEAFSAGGRLAGRLPLAEGRVAFILRPVSNGMELMSAAG